MKSKLAKPLIPLIGITLILLAVLSKRLYLKSLNTDGILSFLAGFALIVICILVFRVVLKNKK
jgi:amino acid permease